MAACCRRGMRHREADQISASPTIFRCGLPVKLPKSMCVLILFYSRGKWRTGLRRSLNMPPGCASGTGAKRDCHNAGDRAASGDNFQHGRGRSGCCFAADRLMSGGRKDASSFYQPEFLHQYGRRQGFHSDRRYRPDLFDHYGLCHRRNFPDYR